MSESLVGKRFWVVQDGELRRVMITHDDGERICGSRFQRPVHLGYGYSRDELLTLEGAITACHRNMRYWAQKASRLSGLKEGD